MNSNQITTFVNRKDQSINDTKINRNGLNDYGKNESMLLKKIANCNKNNCTANGYFIPKSNRVGNYIDMVFDCLECGKLHGWNIYFTNLFLY